MSLFDLIGFSTLYNSNRYLLRDAGGPLRATFHMKCVDKKLFKVKKKKKLHISPNLHISNDSRINHIYRDRNCKRKNCLPNRRKKK